MSFYLKNPGKNLRPPTLVLYHALRSSTRNRQAQKQLMRRTAPIVRFLVATALAPLVLDSIVHRAVQAAIIVTGDSNPAYDNSDPWAPVALIIGDTAPGGMTIKAGSVVNNTGDGIIANTSAASTSSVSVDGAGSTWTNSNYLYVGGLGTGTLDVTGGGTVSGVNTFIADGTSGIGQVTVGGCTGSSALNMTSSVVVGNGGTGTLNITGGGAVSDFNGFIAYTYPSTIGTATVGGGTGTASWTNSGTLYVGVLGTGKLNINTGGTVSTAALYVGNVSSRVIFAGGTLSITATGTITGSGAANNIDLNSGGGTFDIPNAGDTFTMSSPIEGVGSLTKTGAGTLALANGTNIYTGGTTVSVGTLMATNNSGSATGSANVLVNSGATLAIGSGSTSGSVSGNITDNGTVQFNRSNNITYAGQISGTGAVMKQGNGMLTLSGASLYSGGTTVSVGTLLVTNASGSATGSGNVSVDSGATLAIGNAGSSGTVSGNITDNGTVQFNRSGMIDYTGQISGAGAVIKQGSGVNAILTLSGASTYSGGTTVSGGTLRAQNASGSATGSGDVSVDSGATSEIGGGIGTVGGSVSGNIVDNGAVRFNRAVNVAYAGQITGTGTVTKLASGILTISGANTYSGGTTVAISGGTLLANNVSGSATGSGDITVGLNSTLGGTGAVAGNVTVNGTLSPGANIESLGTGSVSFNPGSTFAYELNTSDPAADLVNATGGLSISTSGSGVLLTLSELGTFSPLPIGTKFTLISYDGTWDGGTFIGQPQLSTVTYGFHVFQIRYQDTSPGLNFVNETSLNTTGRFVTLTVLDLVPEPGFITLALIGCCAMGVVRPRQRCGFKRHGRKGSKET